MILYQIKLYDPKGTVIAQLQSLTAKGLRPLWGASQVLKLEGNHLKARLVRTKSGLFELQEFLPKQQGSTSPTPFDVKLNDCQIKFVDQSAGDIWEHEIRLSKVGVSGLGNNWIANANGEIPQVGNLETRVEHSDSTGLKITGHSSSLQLAGLTDHLLKTPELRGFGLSNRFSASSLLTSGPFEISLAPKGPLLFRVSTELQAANIRYDDKQLDSMKFHGVINQDGASGQILATIGKAQAQFAGSGKWKAKPDVGGALQVSNVGTASLPDWLNRLIPRGARFSDASFKGWAQASSPIAFRITGDINVPTLQYDKESATNLVAKLDVDPNHVAVDIPSVQYDHQNVRGNLTIDFHSKKIIGTAQSDHTVLDRLSARFGYRQLHGVATIAANFSGTLSAPRIDVTAKGHGTLDIIKLKPIELTHIETRGYYQSGILTLDRAFAETPDGLVSAKGQLSLTESKGISLIARGVQLSSLIPDATGTINLAGNVTGQLANPRFQGRVEAFDLGYQDQYLPAAVADLYADRKHIQIDAVEAAKGTTSLTGSAALRLPGNRLSGSFAIRDIQLADWLGDPYVGVFDLPSIQLGGTLSHPLIAGTLSGTSILAKGIKIDAISGVLGFDGDEVTADNVEITAADGKLSASGSYKLSAHAGKVVAKSDHLAIRKLIPELSDSISITGTVGGQGNFDFQDNRLLHANFAGDLSSVYANGTPLGSGPWQIQSNGTSFTGSLEIGDIQRYITLDNLTYNPETQKASGDVALFNVQAENLISAFARYIPNLDQDNRDRLAAIKSEINLAGSFDGTFLDTNYRVNSLQATNISYHNQPLGQLDTTFTLLDHRWDIQKFQIGNGPLSVSLVGSVDENGQTHIDGSNENKIDLTKLGALDPRLGAVTGDAHFWFNVDGLTRAPHVLASLKVNNLLAPPGSTVATQNEDKNLRFNLDKIEIKPTDGGLASLTAEGEYFYRGFKGALSASTPFEYPFTIPKTGDVRGRISLDESSLKEIAPLSGGIDPLRTSGTIGGEISVSGSPTDLKISASANLKSESLAINGMTDVLKNLVATANLASNRLVVNAKGESSRGGSFQADLSTPVEDLEDLYAIYLKSGPSGLLDRSIDGKANIDRLQIRQLLMSDSIGGGTVTGDIKVAGNLQTPNVSGQLNVSGGELIFRGVQPSTNAQPEFAINPRLNVNMALSSPARFQSSTANLYLLGNGTLNGSLQYPRLSSSLYVDKGTVRLPASILRIDQGGTVQVSYQKNRLGSTAKVNVDLEGTTSVTTARTSESDIQRYQILLGMKGDLLDSNGINLSASSDPPDLSQDRILGILGQTDFLQSISSGFKQSEAVGAVAQFIVPTLLDPLTADIAKGVGLDYLNVEYNMFDQASITFGKDIGNGFSFVGSRQLSEPPPGFLTRFDVRLIYRPRRVPGALRQIRFFFGADQDRAWKLGLDYGIRF